MSEEGGEKKAVYRVLAKLKLNRIEDPAHSQPSCSESENDRTELKLKYEQSADIANASVIETERITHETKKKETLTQRSRKNQQRRSTHSGLFTWIFPFQITSI